MTFSDDPRDGQQPPRDAKETSEYPAPPRENRESEYPPPPGEEDNRPSAYHARAPSSGNLPLPSMAQNLPPYETNYPPQHSYPPPPPANGQYAYPAPPQGYASDPRDPRDNRGYQPPPYDPRNQPQGQYPQQPAPRQRTAIACRYCRRRKIRCSGFDQSPDGRCLNCQRFQQECIFTPVSSQTQAFVPVHAVYPQMRNVAIGPDGRPLPGQFPVGQQLYGAHGQPLGTVPNGHPQASPQQAPQQPPPAQGGRPPYPEYNGAAPPPNGPYNGQLEEAQQNRKRPHPDAHAATLPPPVAGAAPPQGQPLYREEGRRAPAAEEYLNAPVAPVSPATPASATATATASVAISPAPAAPIAPEEAAEKDPPVKTENAALDTSAKPDSEAAPADSTTTKSVISPPTDKPDLMSLGSIMGEAAATAAAGQADQDMLRRLDRKSQS